MVAILSPAKNIDFKPFTTSLTQTLPIFGDKANYMVRYLKLLSQPQLADLFKVSTSIAETSHVRYYQWDNNPGADQLKSAVFAFNGEVYRGFDAKNMEPEHLEFAQQNIRILSGLYGLLKPLDLIQPYRLEMGTHWGPAKYSSLYKYWGNTLAKSINNDIDNSTGDKLLLNLASVEYSKVLTNAKALKYPFVNVDFRQDTNGKQQTVLVYAKRARGLMARFIAINKINQVNDLKTFDLEGYYYEAHQSTEKKLVFVRHS